MVSLELFCVYCGEVSIYFDMVLDCHFVSCVMGDFSNYASLSFDVVPIVLSICVICICVLGG